MKMGGNDYSQDGERKVVQEICQTAKGRGECHITETEKNDYFFLGHQPAATSMEVRQCRFGEIR